MSKTHEKCANAACHCEAAEGSKYCSARCEELGGVTVTRCPCGHAGCVTVATAGGTATGGW